MRNLLVLTDFSPPAENALLYAGSLAQTVNAAVTILHVYQIPVSLNDTPAVMISSEEIRNTVDKSLARSKELLLSNYPGLSVQTESRLGAITAETNAIGEELQPLAIVTGRHGANAMEQLLFGSTSLSILRHSKLPVLVVPEGVSNKPVANIAVAVDADKEKVPVEKIRSFAEQTGARLFLIHVRMEKNETELSNPFPQLDAEYKTIRDTEFVHGIQNYVQQNNIDLLMIFPHKHSLVEKLMFRTHTEELMRRLTLPILCVPAS